MGILKEIWELDSDPDDATNPYTPYSFIPVGNHVAPINMSLGRDFGRRESIGVMPSMDGVLDFFGRAPGPMDVRELPFTFRIFNDGDNDAIYDRLAAQLAPGDPKRLVYETDSGGLWFTVGSNPKIINTIVAENRGGLGGYLDITVNWRIRPDWRLRWPESIHDRDIYDFADDEVYDALDDEVYASTGTTQITQPIQNFTMDATGIAGYDMPTIPDTGPSFYCVGPLGGDGGIAFTNNDVYAYDTNGTRVPYQFVLPFKLPTSNDSALVRFERQRFWATIGGKTVLYRPFKFPYQKYYFVVKNGIINHCTLSAFGPNIVTGGSITPDFWKKRA